MINIILSVLGLFCFFFGCKNILCYFKELSDIYLNDLWKIHLGELQEKYDWVEFVTPAGNHDKRLLRWLIWWFIAIVFLAALIVMN